MIVNLATHRAVQLPGSEDVWEAEWSPDGRYIAARTVDSHAIMLFDFNTRRWAELVKSDVGYLKWSADARYVYFKRLGSQTAILRVGVRDHKVAEVVSLKEIKNTGYGGGLWIGVTPDNSPFAARHRHTGDLRTRLACAIRASWATDFTARAGGFNSWGWRIMKASGDPVDSKDYRGRVSRAGASG